MSRSVVQIRYNLGSVKINIAEGIQTFGDLKRQLHERHRIPLDEMCITRDQRNMEPILCTDNYSLTEVGIRPGMTIYLAGRYEKKVVEHAYVASGVVTPAGEYIVKCPADDSELQSERQGLRLDEAVSPVPLVNDPIRNELIAPEATVTVAASCVAEPTVQDVKNVRPVSPPFPAHLLDEPLSPQVRQPDKVKKMTLFGPDADDDSDGAEENLEVARLMELNTDAIAELRLAGLSELEIMEALSIDANGRPQPFSAGYAYRRDVREQTRALLGGGNAFEDGHGDIKNTNKRKTTTGMTGSERRRAAQRERLGIQEVSTAHETALGRMRPPQPRVVHDLSRGDVANSWADLDIEDNEEETTATLLEGSLQDEDVAEQTALMQLFEEEQMRKVEAARLKNERTLESIREKMLLNLSEMPGPPARIEQVEPVAPIAGDDGIDFAALGLDPAEVAAQMQLMESFACMTTAAPEVQPVPVTELYRMPDSFHTDDDVEELLQRQLLEDCSRSALDLEKIVDRDANDMDIPLKVDKVIDVAALKMDRDEITAQMKMLKKYEGTIGGKTVRDLKAPPAAAAARNIFFPSSGRTSEQLMSARGGAEFEKATSRGVLTRNYVDPKMHSRSKALADSAVEILSSGRKPKATAPREHSCNLKPPNRNGSLRESHLGICSSTDDMQIGASSAEHLIAGSSRLFGAADKSTKSRKRPVSSMKVEVDGKSEAAPSALFIGGSRPREQNEIDIEKNSLKMQGSTTERRHRATQSRTVLTSQVDNGLLTVGTAAVVTKSRTRISNASSTSQNSEKVLHDIPEWLRAPAAPVVDGAVRKQHSISGPSDTTSTSGTAAVQSSRKDRQSRSSKKKYPI